MSIIDVNDNAPEFLDTLPSNFSIRENATAGTFIGTLIARDSDDPASPNSDVSYTIVDGSAMGVFDLNPNSGVLTVSSALNFENTSQYDLVIAASDNGSPRLNSTRSFTIYIVDVDDNTPLFVQKTYQFEITENNLPGAFVGQVMANDLDPHNRAIGYEFTAPSALFSIDRDNGTIFALVTFNREVVQPQFSLQVETFYQDDPGTPTDTADVVITVVDEDEFGTVIHSFVLGQIFENIPVGTVVGRINATDRDPGSNLMFVLSVTLDVLAVNESGVVFVNGPIDRESRDLFPTGNDCPSGTAPDISCLPVIARVTDQTSGDFAFASGRLFVQDLNDEPPLFTQELYEVSINESTAVGVELTSLNILATDPDYNVLPQYSIPPSQNIVDFTIRPFGGVIVVNQPLDFERNQTYNFTIVAADGAGNLGSATVVITILDENDNAPQFLEPIYNVTVPENSATGIVVAVVEARDRDSGTNGEFSYRIGDGNIQDTFNINPVNGIVTLVRLLNREVVPVFNLTIEAVDDGTPQQTGTVVLNVTIGDVNDHPPFFRQNVFVGNVSETAGIGDPVLNATTGQPLRVEAVDLDVGAEVTIVTFTTGTPFTVNASTGAVTVSRPLDLEQVSMFELVVVAQDDLSLFSSPARVLINVIDHRPAFQRDHYETTVVENTGVGATVLQVVAEDEDLGDQIEYRIISSFNASEIELPELSSGMIQDGELLPEPVFPFAINITTGAVTLVESLDFEIVQEWDFVVIAEDSGGLNDTVSVIVRVSDQNDNPPRFTEHVYEIFVPEDTNASNTDPISTEISATDSDLVSEGNLRYYILSGAEGTFEMNRFNGSLFLVQSPLNPLLQRVYNIEVLVSDGLNEDTARVNVIVVDINNNGPVFLIEDYFATMLENVTAGTSVVQVRAIDNDLGTFGEVSYELVSGDTELFYIRDNTGEIFVNRSNFDFDTPPRFYNLRVEAVDGADPPRSAFANVFIELEDVNDNPPLFTADPFVADVPEASNLGMSIFQVSAMDADAGTNAAILFDILTIGANFTIDADTGIVRVGAELDFDDPLQPREMYLDISAMDSGQPPLSTNGTLIIRVIDSNDNAPYFEMPLFDVYIPENSTVNDTAFVAMAIDDDSGSNAELRYEILSIHPPICVTRFRIVPSGVVLLSEIVDAEQRGEPCTIIIEATDMGTPQRSSQATFVAIVTDINEHPPEFFPETLSGSVLENSPNSTSILTLRSFDDDLNRVFYQAVGGDVVLFDVSRLGLITVAEGAVLDREVRQEYFLTVVAEDDGLPQMFTTATVTITLLDENDSPPVFVTPTYLVSVRELDPLNTPFEIVLARDNDLPPNNIVRYYLVRNSENETDYGKFDIDSVTGEISVISSLDYETERHFYNLQVEATDGLNNGMATVNVRLLESNDESPVFRNLPNTTNLREDSQNDTFVFQAVATDPDLGVNGRIVYSLMEIPGSEGFRIDSETGELFVRGDNQFDFESGIHEIQLFIVATDSAGTTFSGDNVAPRSSGFGTDPLINPNDMQLSTSQTLLVRITDVNDEYPQFTMPVYLTFTIEHDMLSLILVTVVAYDNDEPSTPNSEVRYQIVGGDFGRFIIDDETGVIRTVPPIDREVRAFYEMEVEAFDLGTPSLNSTAIVNVTVINTDDTAPFFTQNLYTGIVNENSPEDTVVTAVTAIDPDDPFSAINYTLFDPSGHFKIDGQTGIIYTSDSPIDREQTQNVTFTVQAVDMNSFSTNAEVFIVVNDVNDQAPIFEQESYFFNITENTPVDHRLIGTRAIDADLGSNAITRYDIEPLGKFGVDVLTGDVIVVEPLCFRDSATRTYTFTLVARDAVNGALNSTASLTISIYKENNFPPVFVQPSYVSALDEQAPAGTVVLPSLRTLDRDICSGPPVFGIVDGNENNTFAINSSSGEVTLTRALIVDDLSFTLTLTATDSGNFHLANMTAEVTLIILIGQLLPLSIVVDGGLTVPTISRLSQEVYQQNIWLFNGGSLTDPPTIRYSIGSLEQEMPVPVVPSTAQAVDAALARGVVYAGEPYVVVGLQVEGNGYEKTGVEATEVYVRIESDLFPGRNTTGSCTTEPPSATCVARTLVPADWFVPLQNENSTARVYYGLSRESANTFLGEVVIAACAVCPLPSVPQVRVVLPSKVIYPGEYFNISVLVNAGYEIHSYLMVFSMAEGLEFVELLTSSLRYSIQTAANGNSFSISALDNEFTSLDSESTFNTDPMTTFEELLIRVRMRSDAPLVSEGVITLNCTVDYVVNVLGRQVFTSEPAVHISFNEDGSCNSAVGQLLASPISVVKLFPYANRSGLLNSVYLNGNMVTSAISVLSFLNSGQFNFSDIEVSCESSDSSVLRVNPTCSNVFLTGNETEGADPVNVLLSSPYGSASIPFRIWFPTGIAVNPSETELNPISEVFDGDSDCSQEYESTRVEVEAVFAAGELRQTAIITQLVRDGIRSSNTSILDLALEQDRVQAFGVSEGTAEILVNLYGTPSGSPIRSEPISITSNFVTVDDVSLTLHSGLNPQSIPAASVGSSYLETSQVQLQSNFRHINIPVSVLTEAVLSDGRNFELSMSNGLQLSSSDMEVLEVTSSNQISLRGSGTGLLLEGILGRNVCPDSRITSNSEFLDIRIAQLVGLEVTLGTTVLAIPDHSTILGVPSETSIEVELVHQDGTVVPVTDDHRTIFNTTAAPFAVTSGTVFSGSSPGEATFTVEYSLGNDGVEQTGGPVTVLSIVELQLSAVPYPSYDGATSEDATTLNRFANTSVYQQAEITLTALLSDGSVRDVTLHNTTVFSISDPSVLSIEGGRVSPVGSGNATITAYLGGLNASVAFAVVDLEISAIEIAEFSIPLQNGTLFATQGTVIVPSLTLRFSDGTYFPNFLSSSGPALPSVVEFSALFPFSADIDNTTGLVRVEGNSISQTSLTAAIPNVDTSIITFFVDLLPRLGEVDIEGLLQTELQEGTTIEVPMYVNVEGVALGAVEVAVVYDDTVLELATIQGTDELADVDRGTDVSPGDFTAASFANDPPGVLRFGGIAKEAAVGTSRLHIATLRFSVLTSVNFTSFNTFVLTLNDFSTVSSPIGDPTVRLSPPATVAQAPVDNSLFTDIIRCSNPPCSPAECVNLTGAVRAGDTNADCTFDLIDALFVQEYVPLLPLSASSANLLPEQLEAMDADRNGRIELEDVATLVEARLGLRLLIPDLTLRPIDAEFSDCRMAINITLQTWDGIPPNTSFAYFGLFHPNPEFQDQYDNTTFNIGTRNLDIALPGGAFGGWLDPYFFGDGVYGIETEPGIIAQRDIGFVLVAGTLDPIDQVPTRLRTVLFTGHPTSTLAYNSLNATFTPVPGVSGVDITLPAFNPQQFFNNSFSAELCYNNHAPEISPTFGSEVIISISEATPINTTLRTITATDTDVPLPAGDILYSLEDVSVPGTLGVNPQTGEVIVAGTLDRESYLRVTATFVATDQGPHVFTRLRDTIPFILLLEDANDNPPLAEQATYSVNVSEGVEVPEGGQSRAVFTFTGRDADVDVENRGFSFFNITDGDNSTSPFFSVSIVETGSGAFTGTLMLVRSLDRETQDSYNITVTLVDAGDPPQSSEVLIQITVADINDQRPIFTTRDEVEIIENNFPTSFVITVSATDADIGPNAQFTYNISSVNVADDQGVVAPDAQPVFGFFSLDPATGILRTARRLDREGDHSFRVFITAVEEGINIVVRPILPLWVKVCEENDNVPFLPDELVANVPENSDQGRVVIQLVGRDLDDGSWCNRDTENAQDNVLRYNLLTPDIPFVIDPISGNISVNGSLDFEGTKNYSMVVEVSDLGVPQMLSSTSNLTIFVTDENDHAPILSNTTYFNLAVENNTIGTVVIDFISATDADSGQNAEIRFNLTGEGSEDFMIDPETGYIRIAQSLDREVRPVYSLTVIAYDLGTPTLSDTALVTIDVIDINDSPPIFLQPEYSVEVSENVPLGGVVLTVTAVDADLGQFREVTYQIVGDSSSLFQIDSLSGEITTTGSLCTYTNVTYSFFVMAEDHPGGELRLRSSVNVTILVYDDNSYDPQFTREEYAAIVAEGTTVGDDVFTIVGTDQDICSPPFTYALLPTSDAIFFSLNSTSGLLTSNTTLSQTVRDLYSLTVSATDSGSPTIRTGTATVYVIVGETVPIDVSSSVGFPVGSPRPAASDSFEQEFDYLYNNNPFQTDQFTARFGTLTSQSPFLVTPLPATRLDALLLTPTVYYDNPVVYIALLAYDEFGSNTVALTSVTVSASSSLGSVNTSQSTNAANTIVDLELPAEWFVFSGEEERTVAVSYGIPGQDLTVFEQVVSLVPQPQFELACENATSSEDEALMVVQVPAYTLYNGQTAPIPVLIRQNDISLSAFSLRCDLDSGLVYTRAPVSATEGWETRYEVNSTRRSLSVAATKIGNSVPPDGFQEILVLEVTVTSGTTEAVGISCYNLDAVDTDGRVDSYSEALVVDRDGCLSEMGSVFVSEDILVGVFAVSDQTVIFNDAVLSGTRRNIFPSIAGVFLASPHRFDNILFLGAFLTTGDLTCSSEHSGVLKVENDCREVYVDGSEVSGANNVRVTFNVTSLSGPFRVEPSLFPVTRTLDFQIWFPEVPIAINPTDTILSPVERWTVMDGPTCTQAYQRSFIQATAVFSPNSSSETSAELRVEHLLSTFQSENTTIARVLGTEIIAVAPGTVMITAAHPVRPGISLGGTAVMVDPIPVRVIDFDVAYSTSLRTSVPSFIPYVGSDPFQASLDSDLQYESQVAHLVTTAVFSDGTRYQVSPDIGLNYSTTDSNVITVSGTQFTALDSGSGPLLRVTWTACDSRSVLSLNTPLDISLSDPEIQVEIDDPILVHPSDVVAGLSAIPTSTPISVRLVYNVGGQTISLDVTNSVSTNYTFSPPGLLSMRLESSGIRFIVANVPNTLATVNVTVRYKSYPSVMATIVLTYTQTLSVVASPYPPYNDSSSRVTTDLSMIGATGVFQQARLASILELPFPMGESISVDITSNPSTQYSATPNNIVMVSQNGIVTPQVTGSVDITVRFSGMMADLSLQVLSGPVNVAAIDRLGLTTGSTLTGLPGQTAVRLSAAVTFLDGTQLDEVYTPSGQVVSGLLSAVSNNPDIFTVDSASGNVVILNNAPTAVSITVTVNDANSLQATAEFYANLQPAVGEVDLGDMTGPPVPPVLPGDTFEVPVRINIGTQSVGSLEVAVEYDDSLLDLISTSPGTDLPVLFASSDRVFAGYVLLGGVFTTPPAPGTLHIGTLTFRALDAALGIAAIRGGVATLFDRNNPPQPLSFSTSPAADISVAIGNTTGLPPPAELRNPPTDFNPSVPPCTDPLPCACSTGKEVGDVDGNCIFNVADVFYLEQASTPSCPDVDFNLDGICDDRDLTFLLRANFRLVHFVQNFRISPVNDTDCFLTVEAELIGRGNQIADPATTSLLFGLFNRDPDFQQEVDSTTIFTNVGRRIGFTGALPASTNGGFFETSNVNDTFRAVLNTQISKPSVGLVLVQTQTDFYGQLSQNLVEIMIGPDSIPVQFPETLNASIEHPTGSSIPFLFWLGFDSLVTFDQTFSSPDCINFNQPRFFPNTTRISLYENQEVGSIVTTVFANDSDSGVNAEVMYFFYQPAEEISNTFAINRTSGEVTLISMLDREAIDEYFIGLHAIDQGTLGTLGGFGELIITVLDVNDNDPTFDEEVYTPPSIPENTPVGYVVETVHATDRDVGENMTLSYSLAEPHFEFEVNRTTGEVYVATELDFEVRMQYNLTVIATDDGTPPRTGTATIVIVIEPINDNGPKCFPTERLALVAENEFANTTILVVNSSDADLGANHNLLFFSLSTSAEFGIRKTSETTADIYTLVATFDRLLTPSYNLTVTVRDVGNLSCTIDLLVVVAEPSRFEFQTESTGFLTGNVIRRRSRDRFDQQVTFFRNSRGSGTITGTLGGRIDMETYNRSEQPLARLHGVLRQSEVWFDNPTISAVAQVRDASLLTTVAETSLYLEIRAIAPNSTVTPETSLACIANVRSGLCSLSVMVPEAWFQPVDGYGEVSVTLTGGNISLDLGTVALNPIPPSATTESNLVVELPTYPLYNGDTFTISVGAPTSLRVIGFQLDLQVPTSVMLSEVGLNTEWACNHQVDLFLNVYTYVCLRTSTDIFNPKTSTDTSTATERFFGITGSIISPTSVPTPSDISANVASLVSVYGSVVSITKPAVVFDRNGLSLSPGQVYLEPVLVVGLLASTNYPELVNTGILDGSNVPVPIQVYAVYNRAEAAYSTLDPTSADLQCSSSPDILINSADCSTIMLATAYSGEIATNLTITHVPSSQSFLLPLKIWQVYDLQVVIPDQELNRVSGWYEAPGCSSYSYQQTRVRLLATFRSGGDISNEVDVTTIAASAGQISSSNVTIATVDGDVVSGNSVGSAEIGLGQFFDDVRVTNEEVVPYSLTPTVFTSLEVSVDPATYTSNSTLTASAIVTQEFTEIGTNGFVAGVAYFSDGARFDIPSDGSLNVSSDTTRVAQVSSDGTITAISSGTAQISFAWTPSGCPNQEPLLMAVSSFTVTAPDSTGLELQATELSIAGNTGGIRFDSLPSSSQVTVFLLYTDGTKRDVTAEVEATTSPSLRVGENLVVSAVVLEPQPANGELNVSYTTPGGQTYTETLQLTLVNINSLEAQLDAYPIPTGTPSGNITLEKVGSTDYWQQAEFVVEAVFSDSNRLRVPAGTQFVSTISEPDKLTVSAEGVVMPLPDEFGIVTITLRIQGGSIDTNAVTVSVVSSGVSIQSIDSLTLVETSPTERRIVCDVAFTDGTVLRDILDFMYGDLSSLLTYSVDPPGVATVDSTMGTLTITGSHFADAILTAFAPGSSASVPFTANLAPAPGQLDLGQDTGIPQPPVPLGNEFTISMRVNVGDSTIGALDVSLFYDPALLEFVSLTPLLPGFSAVRTNSPVGEIKLVFVAAVVTSDPIPLIADITFRANGEGLTEISSFLQVLVDNTLNQTTLLDTDTSNTGNLSVMVESSQRQRREAGAPGTMTRVRRQSEMPVSRDINGDGELDVKDVQSIIFYLIDELGPQTPEQLSRLDSNDDGVVTISDVVFLIRVVAGLVPFFESYAITPVSMETNCMLEISATLTLPSSSDSNYTFVYFVVSHPQAGSLLSVTEASPGGSGTTVDSNSGIFEAYPVDDGTYKVSLFTPLDFQLENVGLSIALFTTTHGYSTSPDRYASFTMAQNTTYVGDGFLVPQIRDMTLRSRREAAATISDVTIGEPDGFSPFRNFNNSLRSDYCRFNASVIPVSVPENQTINVIFRNISALTSNFPSNAEQYRLLEASHDGVFSLSDSGELQLTNSLNYESVTNYTLTVVATVPDLQFEIGTAVVEIMVLDVNDNAPQFQPEAYSTDIPEDVPVGELLVTVEAFDLDSGSNSEIVFTLDPPNGQFFLNSTLGQLSVAQSLDRELFAGYNLTVVATDRGSPPLSTSVTVRITVLDLNDNPPSFDRAVYNIPIPENFYNSSGDNLVTVDRIVVRDPDTAENGTVILSLGSAVGGAFPFTIDNSGYLTVTGTLDREEVAFYKLIVTAMDNSTVPMSVSTNLTVTITDINDNDPVFSPDNDEMLLVEEDSSVGTLITQMVVTDADEGSNAIITYSITEAGIPFEIDSTSGEIRITSPLDLERRQEYVLTIVAQDNGIPARSATWQLTIDIVEGQVVSFDGNGGFLIGQPTRTGGRQYAQEVGYLFGEDIGMPATVSGGINTATSGNFDRAEVPNVGDTATRVEGSVLHSVVSHSLKTVTAFVQVFDSRSVIAEPTSIRVRVTPTDQLRQLGSVSLVDGTCLTSQMLGHCVAQLTLPDEWFARASTNNRNDRVLVWANFASSTENGNLIGEAVVENSPAYAANLAQSRIALVPPSHTVFPSRNFTVEVYVVSPLELVYGGVEADVTWSDGTLTGITFDENIWQCGKILWPFTA